MVNWLTIVTVAIILITLDKTLTVLNIDAVKRNNPGVDPLSIEKNPIAKWSFQNMGLFWGSLIYGVFSFGTFMFALWLFSMPAKLYAPDNSVGVSFYFMCILYALVLMNNFYFFLRYNKLI